MKCELKQRIGHSYVSIAQQIIHEAANVKNDSTIINLCETLDLTDFRKHSTSIHGIAIILALLLP